MTTLKSVGASLWLSLAAAQPICADVPAERRMLTTDDFFDVQAVSDPQVSPDGQWVAYVVTSNDRSADEARSAIWMVSWDGSQRLALTHAASGISEPRWSPDGRYLAFLATPAGSEKAQVMLLDRRGGDARQLTSVSGEIGEYVWSPDGKRLVIAMIQGEGGGTEAAPKPIVIDALHFKQDEEGYLSQDRQRHLYLFDVEGQRLEPLTHDPAFNEDLPVWSPDGRRIAFIRTHELKTDADGRTDIDVIDAQIDAAPHTLVRPYAPNTQQLAWSPDGTQIAYLQGREPQFNVYFLDRLFVVPAAGGAPRALTDALDRAVMSYAFTADSTAILMAVEDDGAIYPARVTLASGAISREGASGRFIVAELNSKADHTVLLESKDHAFAEVYALEAGQLRRLSAHNDALLARLNLGAVEDIRFKVKDGTEIHGILIKPPTYVAGRKYPTLLWIHGGPNGQSEHSLVLDGYKFEPQMFAAKGYVVLLVNYRGGSGRGFAFAKTIAADWGHKEVEDLRSGVDYLIASGIADPDRLSIGGWSYGGILTDYVIASDGRFKAAISGAGSANQISMYGSDQYILQYNHEMGPPWRNAALWLKVSYPFFHADRIHTPTLFVGGEKDFDVPIAGGEQMYEALKTLGVPSQLVIYPGQNHVFTRPSFIKDLADRMIEWDDRYMRR